MESSNDDYDTWEGLLELVADGVTESTHLDFKRDAYANPQKPKEKQEEDKDELRRDATALANSGGGVLLIGVEEDANGRAGAVPGIPQPLKQESWARDVLSRFVEPPFTRSALEVRTLFDPQDETRGVVIVRVSGCEPGLPYAVEGKGDVPLDFWIRADKSKRRMPYLQLRASFRGDITDVTSQSLDAQAISEVRKLGHSLKVARGDLSKSVELLEQLRFYAVEHGHGYSDRVRSEVMQAAGEALHHSRAGISPIVARLAIDIIDEALPFFHMRYPSGREVLETERDLLRQAAAYGWELAYDGAKYLKDLRIISPGSHLLGIILRIAYLNGLDDLQDQILDELRTLREISEERGLLDAVRVLDYQRDQGLEDPDGPGIDIPKGLGWAILGHEGPDEDDDEDDDDA